MTEEIPTNGYFQTFLEEKAWRRNHGDDSWGDVSGVDEGIRDIVSIINGIDFLFTYGDSCSSEPGDVRHKHGIKGRIKGIEHEVCGAVVVRADTSNSRYNSFQKEISELDAIVNAANGSLMGGGGVDGAIHSAAGSQLLEECRQIRANQYPKGLPTGKAVITKGYNLPAKHVIHTVGPVYDEHEHPEVLLANAYRNSLRVAEDNNLQSIAFPAISTGVYEYPREEAAQVVKDVLEKFSYKGLQRVVLCYFSSEDKAIAERIINS